MTQDRHCARTPVYGDTEAAVKWMRAQSNHNGKVGLFRGPRADQFFGSAFPGLCSPEVTSYDPAALLSRLL